MSDLISRQEAIDAIKAASKEIQHWLWEAEGCEGYCAMVADVETCLDDLPSAETHDKRTETHACDLISRQAAIDGRASAQPEIIHCGDCKHWDKTWTNGWAEDYHYCPMVDGVRKADFYCADAERREE